MHKADGNVRVYLWRSEDAENEWLDICLKKGGFWELWNEWVCRETKKTEEKRGRMES